jgi:hypothetical protein
MVLPETYQAALFLMILSMLCWGSWANTLKLCPGYRFQLFYWDYAIGPAACAILWGFTAGSMGHVGLHVPERRGTDSSCLNSLCRLRRRSSTSPTCCWWRRLK